MEMNKLIYATDKFNFKNKFMLGVNMNAKSCDTELNLNIF